MALKVGYTDYQDNPTPVVSIQTGSTGHQDLQNRIYPRERTHLYSYILLHLTVSLPVQRGYNRRPTSATQQLTTTILRQPLNKRYCTTTSVQDFVRQPPYKILYDNHCTRYCTTTTVQDIVRQPLYKRHCTTTTP